MWDITIKISRYVLIPQPHISALEMRSWGLSGYWFNEILINCCCLTDIHPFWGDDSALLPLFQVERQPHGDVNRKSGVKRTQVALNTITENRSAGGGSVTLLLWCSLLLQTHRRSRSSAMRLDVTHCTVAAAAGGHLTALKLSLPRSDRLYPGWNWE